MTRPITERELRQADATARFITEAGADGKPHLLVVMFDDDAPAHRIRQAVLDLLAHAAVFRVGLAPLPDDEQ